MIGQSSQLKLLSVLDQHPQAADSHFLFAECVKNIESVFEHCKTNLENALATELSYLIFDLEVINGLALYEWEISGRPREWHTWKADFYKDAQDLLTQLSAILLGQQSNYIRNV